MSLREQKLADHEALIGVQIEISGMLAVRTPETRIRTSVMAEVWRQASQEGLRVIRGPEIEEFHRPAYPGDAAYVTALAVAVGA